MYPKLLKPYVLSFCRKISQHEPVWVPLEPLANKPMRECFSIIPEHISFNGGEQLNGWAIWELPRVMIEAEFHCVWRRPGGTIVDLTPRDVLVDKILFLPHPEKVYRDRQVNNVRQALTRDRDIERYISLENERFFEMNRASLADYHGPVPVTGRLWAINNEIEILMDKLVRKSVRPR